ncbi:MAG: hypothetical protein WCP69_15445 [Bacteroidota bacterium]
MKKFYLFIVATIFVVATMAQTQNSTNFSHKNVFNQDNDTFKQEHPEFFKNNNKTVAKNKLKDTKSLIWKCDTITGYDTLNVLSKKTIFTYDANGNTLTKNDFLWQNNAWVNSYKFTRTYDSNGNMLTVSCPKIWLQVKH